MNATKASLQDQPRILTKSKLNEMRLHHTLACDPHKDFCTCGYLLILEATNNGFRIREDFHSNLRREAKVGKQPVEDLLHACSKCNYQFWTFDLAVFRSVICREPLLCLNCRIAETQLHHNPIGG